MRMGSSPVGVPRLGFRHGRSAIHPSSPAHRVFAAGRRLVQNEAGWRNLLKLNSRLYLRNDGTLPHVTLEELAAHGEGLICLTGGPDGPVGRHLQNGNRGRAQALLEQLAAIYPDRLYVELQRHPARTASPRPSG
jgi:DNA polymerase III alpha subunit